MSGYGLFQPSTLGMRSQTHRLDVIGTNVANINTGGYKRTDIEFETVLSDKFFQQNDIGGTIPVARPRYDLQGLVTPSNNNLDVAIVGDGFFAVQPDFSSTATIHYTRDGAFGISTVAGQTSTVPGNGINAATGQPFTIADGIVTDSNGTQINPVTVNNGYLTDKNGYFVQGIPANADGTFTLGSPAPMRVDQYAFTTTGQPTTQATLEFNLPANDTPASTTHVFTLKTYDSNANERNITFNFDKSSTNNQWHVSYTADNLTSGTLTPTAAFSLTTGTAVGTQMNLNQTANTISVTTLGGVPVADAFTGLIKGSTITLAGTANSNVAHTIQSVSADGSSITVSPGTIGVEANPVTAAVTSTSARADLTFNALGQLTTPTALTLGATWSDAATSSISVDISGMKQFASDFTVFQTGQNGLGKADIEDVKFDNMGHVVGRFSDGTERNLYKVPLFNFTNANGLHATNGMVFSETTESGTPTAFFADTTIDAEFMPNALEKSNVDIAQEFTKMIQTQTAYNLNAQTFKTVDEMTIVARDLKA